MHDKKLRNTRILIALSFFLVLATGIVAIFSVRGLNRRIEQTIHTKDVLQLSDELVASVLDAESNLRGYTLSGDSKFVSDFTQGKLSSLKLVDSLAELTSDNEEQQANISALKKEIRHRIELLDSIFSIVKINRTELDPFLAEGVKEGKESTQKIRDLIADINTHEYQLLLERSGGMNRYLNILPAILLFTTLTGFGAGAIALYSLYQYNKTKQQADRDIAAYQQQLQDQISRLNLSNKELEQFAYVASHDLQEPLRKISAFGELLNEQYKGKLEGDGELYLERIINASTRMRTLITDLLNYSRVSRNTISEKINLSEVLDFVKEDIEILIKEKKALIHHTPLPYVIGNTSEFRQLFQNLISNSLKFSKQGVQPVISISAQESSGEELTRLPTYDASKKYMSIRFVDNGIGFEEEYAEKIFVIFQRLHGKDSYEGTGIGLAICKKIAEKYGGTIFAKSGPGNGAVFTIVLPVFE